MHLEGDAHVASKDRDRKWTEKTKWTVMDYRSAESMFDRVQNGESNILDNICSSASWTINRARWTNLGLYQGLKGHPRELWLMFFTKLTEYSAYGAASSIFVFSYSKMWS